MKDFFQILKFTKPYYLHTNLNVIFNILTVIFSLVSLTMAIPFLGLLFGTIKVENVKPEGLSLTPESLKDNFYYEINTTNKNRRKRRHCIIYLWTNYNNILTEKSF